MFIYTAMAYAVK